MKLADKAGLADWARKSHRGFAGPGAVHRGQRRLGGPARREGVEPHRALTEVLVEIGRAAISNDAVVLIHIDEVQNITDENLLSQVLIALGDAITQEVVIEVPRGRKVARSLPIAVYLTGLPEFDDRSGARKGATFARRFATTTLEPLGDDDLRSALVR